MTYTHHYIKIRKDLLFGTGHSAQYSVMAYIGKESEKRVDIYMYTPLLSAPLGSSPPRPPFASAVYKLGPRAGAEPRDDLSGCARAGGGDALGLSSWGWGFGRC